MDIEITQDKTYYLIMCLTDVQDGIDIIGKKDGSIVSVRTEIKGSPNMATIQTMVTQMMSEIKKGQK